jgi:hypothetical protein
LYNRPSRALAKSDTVSEIDRTRWAVHGELFRRIEA